MPCLAAQFFSLVLAHCVYADRWNVCREEKGKCVGVISFPHGQWSQ